MRSKFFFVIILMCFSSITMEQAPKHDAVTIEYKPASKELRERVKNLVRVTFESSVRAYMYRCPENEDVQLLKRYMSIATDNYLKALRHGKPLPPQITEQYLTSAICKENLLAIVDVKTVEDLKMRLASLGILYDQYAPCDTWKQLLAMMQERIKWRAKFI